MPMIAFEPVAAGAKRLPMRLFASVVFWPAPAFEKIVSFRPDVALIDIGLPGVDGYALARVLRQMPEARDLTLIALTGYGQADDRQRALDAGFDRHVTKPVDPGRLRELLAGR